MADRACNYCEDMGDCDRCSHFFQPERVHAKCGRKWRDHEYNDNQAPYPGFYTCPKETVV